jgi:hypothetical protein
MGFMDKLGFGGKRSEEQDTETEEAFGNAMTGAITGGIVGSMIMGDDISGALDANDADATGGDGGG